MRCCVQALGSALLYLGSGAAVLLSSLLSFAIVALYAAMFATIALGLVGGFMLGLLAFSLFITSGAAFFGATGAAFGYATLSAAKASLRMLPNAVGRVEVTGPHGLPEAPRLRPVATPRAPVSTLANSPTTAPAVAAVTAAPADPAPASPCRRHATPTTEAFQRADAASAVVSPLSPADPVAVPRVSTGRVLGGSPPAADGETPLKSAAPAVVADNDFTPNPATHPMHHAAAMHARGAGGDATGAGGGAHTSNGEIQTLPSSTPNSKTSHQAGPEALAETERLSVSVPKGHVSGTSPKGAAGKKELLAKGMVADKENRDGVHSADAAAAKSGCKSPAMSVGATRSANLRVAPAATCWPEQLCRHVKLFCLQQHAVPELHYIVCNSTPDRKSYGALWSFHSGACSWLTRIDCLHTIGNSAHGTALFLQPARVCIFRSGRREMQLHTCLSCLRNQHLECQCSVSADMTVLSEPGMSMQDQCSCAVSHTRLAEGCQTGEAAQAALWECAEACGVPTCAPRSFSGWWPSQGASLELCSAISAPPAPPSAAGARRVRR